MQGTILGQKSGTSLGGLNVFAQLNEPSKKDGIWIRTEETVSSKLEYIKLANIPYEFYNGSAVAVGTDIYLLGGNSTTTNKNNYRYDTLTDTYTKMTDIPYEFYNGSAVAVGTDIYLLGGVGASNNKNNYRYNPKVDTYSKLTNMPTEITDGSAVSINNVIYLLRGTSKYKTQIKISPQISKYKYDGIELIKSLTNEDNVLTNKNIYIETEQNHKVKLTKNMQAFISNAMIYDDDEFKDYPAYYGDGQTWNLIAWNIRVIYTIFL